LPNSGAWLLQNREFIGWRNSSVSSVLWLRGIRKQQASKASRRLLIHRFSWVRENKTGVNSTNSIVLTSANLARYTVIEHLQKENETITSPAPVAFFYCVRAEGEAQRADPVEIVRCILKQLSFSTANLPIRKPVEELYKTKLREADEVGCDIDKLTLIECEQLIIALLENNPATIIIDALDECNSRTRYQLMDTLDSIIQKSASVVKIFLSSRDDNDVVCRLHKSPNIFISATDNGADIERFVNVEVAQAISNKMLLGGNISLTLQQQISTKLMKGAQGM